MPFSRSLVPVSPRRVNLNPASNLQTSISRILVVDDYEPWRRLVCSLLQKESDLKVVGEARDGLEAVQKAIDLRADLVLMDIDLSKMNGLEAARRIGDAAQGARILFVSQINDTDVIEAALDNGASGYILKMDAEAELLPAIKAIVRGARLVPTSRVTD